MNKAHFFCSKVKLSTRIFVLMVLLLISILTSCVQRNDTDPTKSAEKINTISVLIDDFLWKGEIGDTIRNKFAAPVVGLPQEEPLFNINQYSIKLLEGFSTNSRNLIIIKKAKKSSYSYKKRSQNSTTVNEFLLTGTNTMDIVRTMEAHYKDIIRTIHDTEIRHNQVILDSISTYNSRIQNKFKLKIKIPKDYKVVRSRKKFIWLKKEFVGGNASIIIYQIPRKSLGENPINNIVHIRDSVGKLYIRGLTSNTYMITENAYAPYIEKIRIDTKRTYETKGTWELKNDFMSGPFINYCILDAKRNRYVVVEGFCYAPSKAKRDIMFELEAVIKGTTIKKLR